MLGIPAIYDRVCQQALLNRLEPIFEPIFDDASFGYRRGRTAKCSRNVDRVIGIKSIWVFSERLKRTCRRTWRCTLSWIITPRTSICELNAGSPHDHGSTYTSLRPMPPGSIRWRSGSTALHNKPFAGERSAARKTGRENRSLRQEFQPPCAAFRLDCHSGFDLR
jgi:hypothetical protein